MFPNLTIITAFYDIGRSKWTGFIGGHPLPSYLKRTTDQYFECFERMLKLDNDIVVFTSPDLVERFDKYKVQKPNLAVIPYEFHNAHPDIREKIKTIQNDPKFYQMVRHPFLPEYWEPNYVLINTLKSYFVTKAIDIGVILTDLVAWLDFAYARPEVVVPNSWSYDFDPEKIHFFSGKRNVPQAIDIKEVIIHNYVFIHGCHIVAHKNKWPFLRDNVFSSLDILFENNWCDDDQTLLLMSYIKNPSEYEIHYIDETQGGWFQIFKKWCN